MPEMETNTKYIFLINRNVPSTLQGEVQCLASNRKMPKYAKTQENKICDSHRSRKTQFTHGKGGKHRSFAAWREVTRMVVLVDWLRSNSYCDCIPLGTLEGTSDVRSRDTGAIIKT